MSGPPNVVARADGGGALRPCDPTCVVVDLAALDVSALDLSAVDEHDIAIAARAATTQTFTDECILRAPCCSVTSDEILPSSLFMTAATERLTADQLDDLMRLASHADSVELKLTVPTGVQRAAVTALGLDPLDAQIRQVFFFDTHDLALNKAGLVTRARRVQGKGDDSVVKLRPVLPDELPDQLRTSRDVVVEVDAMPGGYVCSASFKGRPKTPVRDVIAGHGPIHKLFSKNQRAFFEAHAPEGITMDGLTVLGPIFVLKLNANPEGFDRRLTTELWLYPDNTTILELSTKCAPSEALNVAFASRRLLEERGVDLTGGQQTKTKTALEYFVAHTDAAQAGG